VTGRMLGTERKRGTRGSWTARCSIVVSASDERFKYCQRDVPTSALIGVRRLSHPDLMVEIEAMAVIPTGGTARRDAGGNA